MNRGERGLTAGTNERSLPAGVSEKTFEFIVAAIQCGAHENLDTRTRNLIGIYFGTKAALKDLIPVAGVTTGMSVGRTIRSGLESLWQNLSPDLQEKYPREEVIKLKSPGKRPQHPRNWYRIGKFYQVERQLWNHAKKEDLLSRIARTGMVTEEEIAALQKFFEEKDTTQRPSSDLLDRFSIALAWVG